MKHLLSFYPNRDVRQREIVPPERLNSCHAVVIGVGAIGRQVALQLAALGIPSMDLFDPDIVAVENLAPQGYWPADLGQSKVQATAQLCWHIHPELQLQTQIERFRRSSVRDLHWTAEKQIAVFCCVDTIDARKLIWESLKHCMHFWADGRMAAEVVRVLASSDPPLDTDYASTLFNESEAYTGSCTAKSTHYSASIAAGHLRQ